MRRDFKTGGRVGLSKGGGPYLPLRGATGPKQIAKAFRGPSGFKESQALRSKIVKGTPIRKEYAGLKRAHRTKQRILKARAGRQQAAKVAAGTARLQAKHPNFKGLAARSKYSKTFRRKGIL